MSLVKNLLNNSNKQIKHGRAKLIIDDIKDVQDDIVRVLKRERRDLEKRLISLTDVYPNSTLSNSVVKDDFNAKEILEEIQATKVRIANKTVEYILALETSIELFGDDAIEAKRELAELKEETNGKED